MARPNFLPPLLAAAAAGLTLALSGAAVAQTGSPSATAAPTTTAATNAVTKAATTPHVTPPGHMIAEIQVIPRPVGTAQNRYQYVDAAIAVIQSSGLRYEVHGLGTVVEGPPEKVWALLQAVHQATLEAGAERTLSVIKVSSGAQAGGPRVEDLVKKFR